MRVANARIEKKTRAVVDLGHSRRAIGRRYNDAMENPFQQCREAARNAFQDCGYSIEAIRQYIERIMEPEYRDTARKTVIGMLQPSNSIFDQLRQADADLQLAAEMEDPVERITAYVDIVKWQEQTSNLRRCYRIIDVIARDLESLDDLDWKSSFQFDVALLWHSMDKRELAVEWMRKSVEVAQRVGSIESLKLLRSAGVRLARWGYREEGRAVVDRIISGGLRADGIRTIEDLP